MAPRPKRRALKVTLLVIAVLLVGGVVFASVRLDAIVNRIKDQQVAEVSKTLGRPVKVGRVSTRIFPLSVEVRDVSIAPDPTRPAETLPVLSLARLRVAVAARTIWSLGKRPGLTEVLVEGLTVNVVKHPDGTLNLQNLADKLEPDREPSKPMDEATRERLRQATLDRLRLDGRVHFVDLARGGAAVDIQKIALALDDVSMVRPVTAVLKAAVVVPAENFTLTARVGPAPASLDGAPPLEKLTVKLGSTDLSPLAPFLSAAMPEGLGGLEKATLALDIDVQPGAAAPGGKGPTLARTDLALTGLRFERGEPVDVKLASDVSGDLAGDGMLDLRRFFLGIGAMSLEARGKLAALKSTPRFSDFVVQSKDFDFDTIRKFLPDLDRRAGAVLHGPFSLQARAGGSAAAQSFQAGLDFSAASIEVPKSFRKPSGVPLRLDLQGKAEKDGLDVERLAFQIADWKLGARGTVRAMSSPAPVLALDAEADAPGLDGVLRLLPPVAAGLNARSKLDGTLAFKAKVSGTARALHAELDARLARLAVKVPEASLRGGGFFTVVADQKGKALDATVKADFTALEAIYGDVMRKSAGVPLTLDLVAAQAGTVQQVKFTLQAADLKASGRGELRPAGDDQAVSGEVTVPPFRVRSLTAMLPGLSSSPLGDIRAGARVRVRGRLGAPASMEVQVDDLGLTAGKSDLQGRLALTNLEKPRVDVDLKSSYLDVDDFVPPAPAGAKAAPAKADRAAPGPGKKAGAEAGPLADVTGRVGLDVARGRAAGIDYQGLKGDLKLAKGRAVASVLDVGVFGGRFSGSGTELSLLDEKDPFKARGTLSKIDVGAVLNHFAGTPNLISGRLDANIALGGAGTTLELLQKTLEGILEGGLQQAQLFGGGFAEALLAPVVAKVNALPGASKLLDTSSASFKQLTDRALGEVRTNLKFEGGAVNLSKPIAFDTRTGPVRLDGRVLLGGKWDLAGALTLSPAAATALTANRLQIDQPVPIRLTVTGPIAHPRVAPAALDEVVKVYALAFARSAAGQAVKAKLQGGAQQVLERTGIGAKLPAAASADEAKAKAAAEAAQARARAEAEAAAASEEARRRAAEAQAKAEEEARAKAEEAKRKASEGAKEKLKGLFGR